MPVFSDENFQRYSRALYPVASLLILVPLVDLTLRVYPPQFGSLQWRFVTVGMFLGNFGTMLLGLGLVGLIATINGHRGILRTIGYIALALAAATHAGTLDQVPAWLHFLRIEEDAAKQFEIATWIKVLCALVMAAGTAVGGWRIIKTLGHKMVKLHPINGFAAETASASVILTASHFGIPVSTTHNISAAILGVGVAKRANAIRWTIVERMVWAWILTLPVTGAIAWLLVRGARLLGWIG